LALNKIVCKCKDYLTELACNLFQYLLSFRSLSINKQCTSTVRNLHHIMISQIGARFIRVVEPILPQDKNMIKITLIRLIQHIKIPYKYQNSGLYCTHCSSDSMRPLDTAACSSRPRLIDPPSLRPLQDNFFNGAGNKVHN